MPAEMRRRGAVLAQRAHRDDGGRHEHLFAAEVPPVQ